MVSFALNSDLWMCELQFPHHITNEKELALEPSNEKIHFVDVVQFTGIVSLSERRDQMS